MSNAKKSQPEDEWVDEIELPTDDDFSLAALDFLSADLSQSTGDTPAAPAADDFFDTGALTSLASLGWRDTDGTSEPDDVEEPRAGQNGASANSLSVNSVAAQSADDEPDTSGDSAELLDLVESLTGPSLDDDDEPKVVADSFTQSVPDDDEDDDGLLELAEAFTQSAPDDIDDSLLDLAESFTGEVLETGAVAERDEVVDDDAPTVVIDESTEITEVQAELEAEISADVEPTVADVEIDDPAGMNVVAETGGEPVSADAADGQDEPDLLALAESATEIETPVAAVTDDELLAIVDIAEAATSAIETTPAVDEELLALVEGSASDLDILRDAPDLFGDLVDISADAALDVLFEDNTPTDSELDALLDSESRYLDQIVAGLDAEAVQFEADEAQEIELLTARHTLRDGEQYVVFTLGDTSYGIPVANVLEVGEPQSATHVPFVPDWVRGIINLRGEIVSLVDLRRFLHGTSDDEAGWMIISQTRDEAVTVGLLVDDVRGNRQFSADQRSEVGMGLGGESARFLASVFEENGQMIAALDFDRLLNSAEMRQFEAM